MSVYCFFDRELSNFIRSNLLRLKLYINSAKDVKRLVPNYPANVWDQSGWIGLLNYLESDKSKESLVDFKNRLIRDDPELVDVLKVTQPVSKPITQHQHWKSRESTGFEKKSKVDNNTLMEVLLESDNKLFKLVDDLFSNFNTMIRFILEDNTGMPPGIIHEISDHEKICNVAIYRDLCRHQSIARFLTILAFAKIEHPIIQYLSKSYNINADYDQIDESISVRDLYCPVEDDMRERMNLSNQIHHSYKTVQSLQELKKLMEENAKNKDELNEKLKMISN